MLQLLKNEVKIMRLISSDGKPVLQIISNENPQLSKPRGLLTLVVKNERIRVKMKVVKVKATNPKPLKLVVDRDESLFDQLEELYSDNYSFRCNEQLS